MTKLSLLPLSLLVVFFLSEAKLQPDPTLGATYLDQAEIRIDSGDYDKALDILKSIIGGKDTTTAKAFNLMGIALQKKGDFEDALANYEKAVHIRVSIWGEKHHKVASSYYNMGLVYSEKSEYSKALDFHEKALKMRLEILKTDHSDVADSFDAIGLIHQKKSKYSDALDFHEKALKIRLKTLSDDHLDIAKSYNHLGLLYWNTRDYQQAVKFYEKALAITIEALGDKHRRVATIYNNIGMIYWSEDYYDQALKYFQAALNITEAFLGADHPTAAAIQHNIGAVYSNQGKYDRALEFYFQALNTWEGVFGDKNPNVADAYSGIGDIYDDKGDYQKALQFYQRALDIRLDTLGNSDLEVAESYFSIGICHWRIGKYLKALEHHQQALDIYLKLRDPNHPDIAYSYIGMGAVYLSMGDYDKALIYHQQALDIALDHKEGNRTLLATLYGNLGAILWEMGDFNQALEFHEKALEARQDIYGNHHPAVAGSYYNLGILYKDKEEFEKALEQHQRALDIRLRIFGEHHPSVADSYDHIGRIYGLKGNYYKALQLLQQALDIYSTTLNADHPSIASSHQNLGAIYEQKGNQEKALEFNQKALEILLKTFRENDPKMATAYNQISSVYRKKSAYRTAVEFAEKAIGSMEQMRRQYASPETKKIHLASHHPIFENAIYTLKEAFDSTRRFNEQKTFIYSEKAKSNLLLEALNTTRAQSFGGIPDILLQREYNLRDRLAYYDKKRFEERQKETSQNDSLLTFYNHRLFNLRQSYEALIDTLEKDYPDYYRLKYQTEVISVPEVQRTLKENQALIEYFAGDSTLYAFVITPEDFLLKKIDRDFPLRDWVRELRQGLYSYHYTRDHYPKEERGALYRRHCDLYVENATRLYDKLIRPLGVLPEKLIIIPDGYLSYLPFEILLSDKPMRSADFRSHPYLVRRHQISYNFSATLWQWMKDRKNRARKGMLVIAPSFTGTKDPYKAIVEGWRDLGPLPYSTLEADTILQLLNGQLLAGPEATADKFRSVAADYRFLHFATHAKLNDSNIDYSFLAFSETTDSSDQEKISIRDLYELQLRADMVVLSACETGVGELRRGEGLISLARGFAYAGAKSLVTSLWSVNDKSTAEIMIDFYRQLKKGKAKDEALQIAKLNYLKKKRDVNAIDPFFWAGFVAIGDMAPVYGGNFSWWLGLLVVLSIAALIGFFYHFSFLQKLFRSLFKDKASA